MFKALVFATGLVGTLPGLALAEGWVQNPRCASCMDYVEADGSIRWLEPPKGSNGTIQEVSSGSDMGRGSYHCRQIATNEENARLVGNEVLRKMEANNYALDCR